MERNASPTGSGRYPAFDAAVAWVLGVALIASGVPHLGNPYYFLGSIYSFDLVGPRVGQAAALWLPFLHVVLAICLVSRVLRGGAHLIALPMFLGFAAIQTVTLARGLPIGCGCFGPRHESVIGWSTLAIVYGLTLLSLGRLAALWRWHRSSLRLLSKQPIVEEKRPNQ